MTKSRQAADIFNVSATQHKYDQSNISAAGRSTVLGNSTYGESTVSQTRDNQYSPSVGAAIDGLVYSILPVGAVLTTDSIGSPGGVIFREDLTFTGISDNTWVDVYGIQVAVLVSDDGTAIAAKAKIVLDDSSLFQSVVQTSNILTVTHNDRFPHPAELETINGVTITGVILDTSTDAHLCYGDWTNIHNTTLGATPVYYWLRSA